MSQRILLCCDLDRTLVPNGSQKESRGARPLFSKLAKSPALTLAYVSGRDLGLLQEAISSYDLPVPQFAVGDVGSSVYAVSDGSWEPVQSWVSQIAGDWSGHGHAELQAWCANIAGLKLQEATKQGVYKLSYYTAVDVDRHELIQRIDHCLREKKVHASILWSLDEPAQVGLLDILPARATKLHAMQFLMELTEIPASRTLFAGDSGNDMPVLESGLQSVLVANASPDVRREALDRLRCKGLSGYLYVAEGGFNGMNGNYAAGVLEGLAHFFPETEQWIR